MSCLNHLWLLIPLTLLVAMTAAHMAFSVWSLIDPLALPFEISAIGGLTAIIASHGSVVEIIGLWALTGGIAAFLLAALAGWGKELLVERAGGYAGI